MQIPNPHEHRLTLAIDPGTRQMGVAVYNYTDIYKTLTIKGPAKIKDYGLTVHGNAGHAGGGTGEHFAVPNL